MKPSLYLIALLAAPFTYAQQRVATIYLQPIVQPTTPPSFLAEVTYDVADPSSAAVTAFDAPELPEDAALLRIGVYDTAAARWLSSTTVTSVDNFAKGYAPSLVLTVDGAGVALGASLRGVSIDAGQTRDFGPQVAVVVASKGAQPELNKPVVLSPEGKKVAPEEEKTLLQKYWWVLALGAVFLLTSGGGDGK